MKIRDLRIILNELKINPKSYAINGDNLTYCEVSYFIDEVKKGKYEVYFTERNELQKKYNFDNENDACMQFLAFFIQSSDVKVCKYFKKGKKYNVSLWRQEQIDKYGSEEEGMA